MSDRVARVARGPGWTGAEVAARLEAAFRARPRTVDDAAAIAWPALYLDDAQDRDRLLIWARCKAEGRSFRELCRENRWPRETVKRRREQACGTIAAALNAKSEFFPSVTTLTVVPDRPERAEQSQNCRSRGRFDDRFSVHRARGHPPRGPGRARAPAR